MADIIQFKAKKPSSILPHIDQYGGWKFSEEDKDFLIGFYKNWIEALTKEAGGDFIEQPTCTLNSIIESGVKESKDLIQMDAVLLAESVNYNIYEFYSDYAEILKIIENSILDVRW